MVLFTEWTKWAIPNRLCLGWRDLLIGLFRITAVASDKQGKEHQQSRYGNENALPHTSSARMAALGLAPTILAFSFPS